MEYINLNSMGRLYKMNPEMIRRPYGYGRRPFGFGYGGFGFPLGFLGGLAAGTLIRPPYYPYYPPYPVYPYYGGFYY
jgi:hypothetical protein